MHALVGELVALLSAILTLIICGYALLRMMGADRMASRYVSFWRNAELWLVGAPFRLLGHILSGIGRAITRR
jgi:NhaP-type Na+/H+ or K+/H+ antiporter